MMTTLERLTQILAWHYDVDESLVNILAIQRNPTDDGVFYVVLGTISGRPVECRVEGERSVVEASFNQPQRRV